MVSTGIFLPQVKCSECLALARKVEDERKKKKEVKLMGRGREGQ